MIAILEARRAGLLGRSHWARNVVAGVIVGVVALPLAMAFAIASGAKPEQGLYTAIVAGLCVSLFGGSRVQIAGPTGAFIVIDRVSNLTLGAGMIEHGLRRATNVHWQALDVNKATRAATKNQKPVVLWFTGLSGAGKSTIANLVEKKLLSLSHHTYLLDGDNVRHGLNKDLGFTDADRVENIRRVAEVSKLMVDAGLITLVSFISPFRAERQMARELLDDGEFIEIFVSTSLDIAEQRDVKGLYARARAGEIKNFTGIDSPYEAPENPDITVDTSSATAEAAAEQIVSYMFANGYLASEPDYEI